MNFDSYHRYECPHCRIPICGNSPQQLANNLNDHNDQKHPDESSRWSAMGIQCSMRYMPPVGDDHDSDTLPGLAPPDSSLGYNPIALPQYTSPHGTSRNSHLIVDPKFPRLTPDDITMLREKKIRWEI